MTTSYPHITDPDELTRIADDLATGRIPAEEVTSIAELAPYLADLGLRLLAGDRPRTVAALIRRVEAASARLGQPVTLAAERAILAQFAGSADEDGL